MPDDMPQSSPGAPSLGAANPDDLKAITSSSTVIDAAGVSAGLWISYLFVLFYLLIAAGGVTHRDLFLANPIRLPFLNVELPLQGFFWLGPALFLVVHTYVLLHFVLLSSKIGAFDAQLRAQIDAAEVRTRLRRQLPINIFVQFLAGPREVREGPIGFLLRLIAWITLVVGPVALLVFFELQFLPYHDAWITRWQRIAVVIDLGLLWLLWPTIVHSQATRQRWQGIGWGTGTVLAGISLMSSLLVFAIATSSGGRLEAKLAWFPLRQTLVAGEVDEVTRKPTSPWSNRLVLPGFDVTDHAKLDEAKIAAVPETGSLRGRHLEGAVLIDARLQKLDFSGAFLSGANLFIANLSQANLSNAHLSGAILIGANLSDARLSGAFLSGALGANLSSANLRGANLNRAHLRGANLSGADLSSANLSDAEGLLQEQLDEACGTGAKLPKGFTLQPCPTEKD